MHRESVIRYAKADRFPEKSERPVSPGMLETSLRTRFLEGENKVLHLFREIVARGYRGSRMTVQRFIQGLRAMTPQGIEITSEAMTKEMTPHRVVVFLLCREDELTEEEKIALSHICQLHSHIKRITLLFQHFLRMLRERRGEELDDWLHAAFHSGIPEMRAFVNTLRQDQEAVQAVMGRALRGKTCYNRGQELSLIRAETEGIVLCNRMCA